MFHALRERGARYVAGATDQPVAVLLTREENKHYLDLLDDEADSQDAELAGRLVQTAVHSPSEEWQSLRNYLRQHETSYAKVPGWDFRPPPTISSIDPRFLSPA